MGLVAPHIHPPAGRARGSTSGPSTQPALQQQVVAAAEESEEESPDEETALPTPLQRQGSVCSLPISCGSENELGPDSTSSPVLTSVEPRDKLLETEQPQREHHPSDNGLSHPFRPVEPTAAAGRRQEIPTRPQRRSVYSSPSFCF